ncbi:MAG: polysaccharide deacetylase family protein [Magnetococcales bacterium]|nr:polysaccharide deacetylase family protein [Magnetococcales bacterium]
MMWCIRSLGLIGLVWLIGLGASWSVLAQDAEVERKTVYLTFDDGPREGSREILERLTREETPATFFIVGGHIINAERRETFERLRTSPLVQLANHSFSHAREQYQAFYANPEGMLVDFSKNNEILGFTQPPYPTRLPGRIDWRFDDRYIDAYSLPRQSTHKIPRGVTRLFDKGFVIYGWDVEWGRPGKQASLESVEAILTRIRKRLTSEQTVKPGRLVLLMHDFHFNTPQALDSLQAVIQGLKGDGVAFGWMRDY